MMLKGDWGSFPNKQICEDCTEGKISKMSEPVQVYTACQFVNLKIIRYRPLKKVALHIRNVREFVRLFYEFLQAFYNVLPSLEKCF